MAQRSAKRTPRSTSIQVLRRAAAVVEAVASAGKPLGLTEICAAAHLQKTTAFNILQTLAEVGYLWKVPGSHQYRLGPAVLRLGFAFQESTHLPSIARPHMVELRDATGETVTLHVQVGWRRVCIDQVTSEQSIRRVAEVGRERPLHVGAAGPVFLSALDETELDEYLAQYSPGDTATTPPMPVAETQPAASASELRAKVAAARSNGWHIEFDQTVRGVSAVAVPIYGPPRGDLAAALVASGPLARWTEQAMRRALPTIVEHAGVISRELGWLHPSPEWVAATHHQSMKGGDGRGPRASWRSRGGDLKDRELTQG